MPQTLTDNDAALRNCVQDEVWFGRVAKVELCWDRRRSWLWFMPPPCDESYWRVTVILFDRVLIQGVGSWIGDAIADAQRMMERLAVASAPSAVDVTLDEGVSGLDALMGE